MVPNMGTQQVDPPVQTLPPPASENKMMEASALDQLADTTMDGTDATIGGDDDMIDVEGFYSDHPEEGHKESTTKKEMREPQPLILIHRSHNQ